MGDVIWQGTKPNTSQRGPVLILWLQLRQAAVLDQEEVRSVLQPLLLSQRDGLQKMIAVLGLADRFREDDELIHIGLAIADGSMKYEELVDWILEHEG